MKHMDALWKEPQFAVEWFPGSGPLWRQYYQDPPLKMGKLPARMPRSARVDLLLNNGYTADQANGTNSRACNILGVTRREGHLPLSMTT